MNVSSPYHDGELAAHQRVGVAAKAANRGAWMLRNELADEQRWFLADLPFVVAGAIDRQGWPWATLLDGAPGLITAAGDREVRIAARPYAGDPLEGALAAGAAIGLLGIDLPTRMRLRVNGRIETATDTGFALAIDQCYGNCPAWITPRKLTLAGDGGSLVADGPEIDAAGRAVIAASDTAFVASSTPPDLGAAGAKGVDVSHRGGPPGFVRIGDDGVLTVPDYAGNDMFNTLGNLLTWPRAGLTFLDVAGGGLLQVTGEVEVVWEGPEIAAFQKAKRLWRLIPRRVVRRVKAYT